MSRGKRAAAAPVFKIHRSSKTRRGYPIHAYIGPNGGGKSLAMVMDALPTLAAGRQVVSTVRILDAATGEPHPLWVPLDSYKTLLEAEHCRVQLDEVTGVASSRESAGMPAAIANRLVQLRRADVDLAWTAPSWARADKLIRECTQAVTLCQGFLAKEAVEEDRQWRQKRLFLLRTYDAAAFDEWNSQRKEKVRPECRQFFWRPGSLAEQSYDTYDAVLSLGGVTDAGACMECDGYRPRVKCSCVTPAKVVIPETDDTPAVAVELPTGAPLRAVGSV